ncbi:MAG: magnesium transporter [Christensenellales bacterium]
MGLENLAEMLQNKQFIQLREQLSSMQAADVAEYIQELENDKQVIIVFRLLPKTLSADVFALLDADKQTVICSLIDDHELKSIIDDLYFDDMIDLLEEVPAYLVKRIMLQRGAKERHLINQFLKYRDNSAGSLMTIEFVDLHKDMTVEQAMKRIRRDAAEMETVYNCYVIDGARHLDGIVSLKDIIVAETDARIEDIMEENPTFVFTGDDQEVVAGLFQKYDLLALPVTDAENRLVGIITVDDVMDVVEEEATEDILKMGAITPSQESYLSIGVMKIARARVPWLFFLMISAAFTGMIISYYEDTLAAVVVLTACIPMLMNTAGNAGSQTSTTIIRALTLGEIGFKDVLRVVLKELRVSIICGVTLGVVNFARLYLLTPGYTAPVALVVSATLVCTVIFAQIIGSMLPMLASKIGLDPALMAAPLITTIVDAAALVLYFSIATAVLGL